MQKKYIYINYCLALYRPEEIELKVKTFIHIYFKLKSK